MLVAIPCAGHSLNLTVQDALAVLTDLPADTIDDISQSIQGEMVEILQQRNADDMDSPVVESAATEPPPKREKEASFEEILW